MYSETWNVRNSALWRLLDRSQLPEKCEEFEVYCLMDFLKQEIDWQSQAVDNHSLCLVPTGSALSIMLLQPT